MATLLRKVGVVGLVFLLANILAAAVSVAILMLRRRQATLAPSRSCSVCRTSVPVGAKYCAECGSRT